MVFATKFFAGWRALDGITRVTIIVMVVLAALAAFGMVHMTVGMYLCSAAVMPPARKFPELF